MGSMTSYNVTITSLALNSRHWILFVFAKILKQLRNSQSQREYPVPRPSTVHINLPFTCFLSSF